MPKRGRDEGPVVWRRWSMPNGNTFSIPAINEWMTPFVASGRWVDPFVRNSVFKAAMAVTNDLNPEFEATHHMDCVAFMRALPGAVYDGVLFDPPYTLHQTNEMYDGVGGPVKKKAAAAMYDECARVLVAGGRLLTFGQDTNGPGERRGFRLVQVGVVPHGGSHSDTLVAEWVLERHVPMRKPLAPAVMGA